MSKRPFIVFGVFAAIAVIVIPIVALGKEGDEDAATVHVASRDRYAQQLVANNCRQCHTLAAAGIQGVVGPNLDNLLVPSGVNSSQQFQGIYSRVLAAVTCGRLGRMPQGILQGDEAKEAAAFIGAYAGQIGKGPTVDTADEKLPDAAPCPTAAG